MTTFSARFLGCKVSFADAQAIRERLLADGHAEADVGDVAVVNTCCVTHEAVSKSRQAVSRAAREHGRVYVTGCGARLEGAFGPPLLREPDGRVEQHDDDDGHGVGRVADESGQWQKGFELN